MVGGSELVKTSGAGGKDLTEDGDGILYVPPSLKAIEAKAGFETVSRPFEGMDRSELSTVGTVTA
jgi:hypothetical protein